jgi:hypothetical protein
LPAQTPPGETGILSAIAATGFTGSWFCPSEGQFVAEHLYVDQ